MSDAGKGGTWKAWLARTMAIAGIVAVINLACALFAARQPPEERRWANADVSMVEKPRFTMLLAYGSHPEQAPVYDRYAADWRSPTVAVYSSPAARAERARFTLKDLLSNGQAHAIDLVAAGPGPARQAWLELTKALTGSADDIERKDPYRADRVLIATVTKGVDTRPGDRLLWTRVYVQPINFEFAGYTVAATDNKTLKLVSVESTDSNKLAFNPGLEAGLPKSKSDQAFESTHKTTADVSQQYENLGIDIQPNFLRIIRESAAGGDVAGNAAIALSIVTDPVTIWRGASHGTDAPVPDERLVLFVERGHLTDGARYLEAPDAKITVLPQSALPHCPLKARVWMLYQERKITDGNAHYIEGLQHVELIKNGDDIRDVEIVRADDIAPAVWTIQMEDGPSGGKPLKAQTKGGSERDLVFTDYVTASELTHWLKAHALGTELEELSFPSYTGQTLRPFKNIKNDCAQQYVKTTEAIPFR